MTTCGCRKPLREVVTAGLLEDLTTSFISAVKTLTDRYAAAKAAQEPAPAEKTEARGGGAGAGALGAGEGREAGGAGSSTTATGAPVQRGAGAAGGEESGTQDETRQPGRPTTVGNGTNRRLEGLLSKAVDVQEGRIGQDGDGASKEGEGAGEEEEKRRVPGEDSKGGSDGGPQATAAGAKRKRGEREGGTEAQEEERSSSQGGGGPGAAKKGRTEAVEGVGERKAMGGDRREEREMEGGLRDENMEEVGAARPAAAEGGRATREEKAEGGKGVAFKKEGSDAFSTPPTKGKGSEAREGGAAQEGGNAKKGGGGGEKEGEGGRGEGVEGDGGGKGGAGVGRKEREMSPGTMALLCDEPDSLVPGAQARGGSESPGMGPAGVTGPRGAQAVAVDALVSEMPLRSLKELFAAQERAILVEFSGCLKRIVAACLGKPNDALPSEVH